MIRFKVLPKVTMVKFGHVQWLVFPNDFLLKHFAHISLMLRSCVHPKKIRWSGYPVNFFLKHLASMDVMLRSCVHPRKLWF